MVCIYIYIHGVYIYMWYSIDMMYCRHIIYVILSLEHYVRIPAIGLVLQFVLLEI